MTSRPFSVKICINLLCNDLKKYCNYIFPSNFGHLGNLKCNYALPSNSSNLKLVTSDLY